jgi:hypothetical protein
VRGKQRATLEDRSEDGSASRKDFGIAIGFRSSSLFMAAPQLHFQERTSTSLDLGPVEVFLGANRQHPMTHDGIHH